MRTERIGRVDNVGTLDRVIRSALALAVVLASVWGIQRAPEWTVAIALHAFVTTAYLVLTARGGFDPAYALMGWSTKGGAHRARTEFDVRRGKPRL